MTNEQIVSEVLGGEVVTHRDGTLGYTLPEYPHGWFPMVDFLADHNAAMMVVEKMREDGIVVNIVGSLISGWIVNFENKKGEIEWSNGANLCQVICSAALKAKGG